MQMAHVLPPVHAHNSNNNHGHNSNNNNGRNNNNNKGRNNNTNNNGHNNNNTCTNNVTATNQGPTNEPIAGTGRQEEPARKGMHATSSMTHRNSDRAHRLRAHHQHGYLPLVAVPIVQHHRRRT